MQYVAKAFVQRPDGKVLILTRSDTRPRYPLHDDLPGGEIDQNESHVTGLLRELVEEAGIRAAAAQVQFIAETVHSPELTYLVYSVGVEDHPSIFLSWEHSAYHWTTIDTLLRYPQPEGYDSYFRFALAMLITHRHLFD